MFILKIYYHSVAKEINDIIAKNKKDRETQMSRPSEGAS